MQPMAKSRLIFACAHTFRLFLFIRMVQVQGRACSDTPHRTDSHSAAACRAVQKQRAESGLYVEKSCRLRLRLGLDVTQTRLQRGWMWVNSMHGCNVWTGGGGGAGDTERLSSQRAFLSVRNARCRQVPHCRPTCLNRKSQTHGKRSFSPLLR